MARGSLPDPGYGSPAEVRGLNRDGYREVLVSNVGDLENVNPEEDVAIIASGVGKRKKLEIMELAHKKNIKIGNHKFI